MFATLMKGLNIDPEEIQRTIGLIVKQSHDMSEGVKRLLTLQDENANRLAAIEAQLAKLQEKDDKQ